MSNYKYNSEIPLMRRVMRLAGLRSRIRGAIFGWLMGPYVPSACPCLHIEPCHDQCTCRNTFSSSGCFRCCSYGSSDQQRMHARHLADRIDQAPPIDFNDWVVLAGRTNDPKLTWLENELASRGIKTFRKGHTFYAPILWIERKNEKAGWGVLNAIDDIPDDDERFIQTY